MGKVKVYRVKVLDGFTGQWTVPPRMVTRDGVAIVKGVIIDGTEIEIDEAQLEDGEQWTPRDFTPG